MFGTSGLTKIRKLRGRSFAELRHRGGQAIFMLLERFGGPGPAEPTDAQLERWLARPGDLSAALEGFPRSEDLRRAAAFAVEAKLPWSDATVAAADRVVKGDFDLLGFSGLSFGAELDWHLDPVAGRRAPQAHWSRIPFLDPDVVGDHKVIWEVNRHHHLVLLGRAYRLTGDESYARVCAHHLGAWMDSNPPKAGINWASSLEVSYRLIAWIWCLRLFEGSTVFDATLRRRLLKYAHVHATHVERYLSTYFSPNTHLTGEALGLWYAGNAMPFFRRARRWKVLGWSILESQLARQVYPDGVYFEQASYYQRYTIDIYTHAILVARAVGHDVPESMVTALERLSSFLAAIARPDGSIPFIGDDDGGQLLRLEERHCSDARAAFAAGSILCGAGWLGRLAPGLSEETLWLFGPESATRPAVETPGDAPSPTRLFPDGGYAVMRDRWGAGASAAVIDCGPLGTANGGHGHADALAVLITVGGRPLFIDPGTFTYTTDLAARNHFRDSRAHNTVTIDDISSSVPAGPFTWQNMARARVQAFHDSETATFFCGTHDGYDSIGARHQRRVLFLKRASVWLVWDVIDGADEHSATAVFQCAANVRVEPRGVGVVDFFSGAERFASMTALGDAGPMEVASSDISECYGSRRPAPVCRATSTGRRRHDLVFVIRAARDGDVGVVRARRDGRAMLVDVAGAASIERFRAEIEPDPATPTVPSLVWLSGSTENDLRVAGSWTVAP